MSTLAAARADNFYYPPEWTPQMGSLNKFQGQHPLRERAKKIGEGILVIRFEMPFNIWCDGCGSMIAKGVRFNAEKKQIGNYFSTKIWSFKMKSACCQSEIEVHTDPKATEYIIVSGAKRKTETYEAEDAETLELPDKAEKERLVDPLARLEHTGLDRARAASAKPVLIQLQRASEARYSDPYSRNRELRAQLRSQKARVAKEVEEARAKGLGIRLLPPSEEDSLAASQVKFASKFEDTRHERRSAIRTASIFSDPKPSMAPPPPRAPRIDKARAGNKSGSGIPSLRHSQTQEPPPGGAKRRREEPRKATLDPKLAKHAERIRAAQKLRTELIAKRRRIDGEGAHQLLVGGVRPLSK